MFMTSAFGSKAPGAVIDRFGADLDSEPGTAHSICVAGADRGSMSSRCFGDCCKSLRHASATPIADASPRIGFRSSDSSVGDLQKKPLDRAENGEVSTFHHPRLRRGVGRVDWRLRDLILYPEKLFADIGGCRCSSSSKTVHTDRVALWLTALLHSS